jgi:antitoxin (DNA-binding transcriptional repressor) of toxin-antitoxin stability system
VSKTVNIYEAKAHFSELVERAAAGERSSSRGARRHLGK